mmetsp:Transcript_17153/g.35891  ORF Transcript_17153/g.35891 Transcript_17153/m.35891 type:complete len:552 (+) Transcript_17153:361-2016(+)
MDSMLQEARLLNSDLGRHCVRTKFTSHLSGRFYNNSSLQRHTAKRRNLSRMQAKVRKLEREHKLQLARNEQLLLIKKEVERKHELMIDRLFKFLKGLTKLQSYIRRKLAIKLYREMKEHRFKMLNIIARFCQIRYRGWKGRLRVRTIREAIRQKLMNDSATIIQAGIRGWIERKRHVQRKRQRELLYNQSAIIAQTFWRGQRARVEYFAMRKELRNKAALDVQRMYRGMRGRRNVAKMREEIERAKIPEKPKRIPLYKRRYSTYGAKLPASRAVQGGFRKRDDLGRNSGSTCTYVGSDKEDSESIATTTTSLSQLTKQSRKRRVARGKEVFNSNKTTKSKWSSAQKIIEASSKIRKYDEKPARSIIVGHHNARARNSSSGSSTAGNENTGSKGSQSTRIRNKSSRERVMLEPAMLTSSSSSRRFGIRQKRNENISTDRLVRNRRCSKSSCTIEMAKRDDCRYNRDDDSRSCTSTSSLTNSNKSQKQHASMPPLVEESGMEKMGKSPLAMLAEASLIVGEVFRDRITHLSVMKSGFEHSYVEHEDDLERFAF